MSRAYDAKVMELEARLATMQQPASSTPPPAFQSMIDSALAASASRLASLKKAHNHLLTRYTELEIKYIELQAANELDRLPSRTPVASQYNSDAITPILTDNDATQGFSHRQEQRQHTQHHHHHQDAMSPKSM